MANWGNDKNVAGDKPNFPGLDAENITGYTVADGKPAGAQHIGWVHAITVPGSVTNIEVTEGGEDHIDGTTTVTIDGDGTGAEAEAVIEGGAITAINITDGGSGYTEATVEIGEAGTGAEFEVTVSSRVKKETLVAFGSMVE